MSGFFSWMAPRAAPATAPAVPARTCFHCGLPLPTGVALWVEFEGEPRPMCCMGCEALCAMVIAQGLGDYYRQRDAHAGTN